MKINYLLFLIFALVITSCSHEPKPINFGRDECTFCKMTITQNQWGAEILTKKGRAIKFDAAECMAKYINTGTIHTDEINSTWIVDYGNPGRLVDCNKAYFLHSESLPSPMAMFLTGFADQKSLNIALLKHQGQILRWKDVLELVKKEWSD